MNEKVYYYKINGYNIMQSNVAEKDIIIAEWNSNHFGRDKIITIERIKPKEFYHLLNRKSGFNRIMASSYEVED